MTWRVVYPYLTTDHPKSQNLVMLVAAQGDTNSDKPAAGTRSAVRLSAPRIAFTDDTSPETSCSEPAESDESSAMLRLPTPHVVPARTYR